jgi:hypothetical protein
MSENWTAMAFAASFQPKALPSKLPIGSRIFSQAFFQKSDPLAVVSLAEQVTLNRQLS